MPYYRTCPICGAHLDPGEICDCQLAEAYKTKEDISHVEH